MDCYTVSVHELESITTKFRFQSMMRGKLCETFFVSFNLVQLIMYCTLDVWWDYHILNLFAFQHHFMDLLSGLTWSLMGLSYSLPIVTHLHLMHLLMASIWILVSERSVPIPMKHLCCRPHLRILQHIGNRCYFF